MDSSLEKTEIRLTLCLGSSCHSRGNRDLTQAALDWKAAHAPEVDLHLSGSLCLGRCSEGPLALLQDRLIRLTDQKSLGDALESELPLRGLP